MTNPAGVISVELVDGTKVLVPDSLELITPYVLQEQGDWFEDEIKFLRKLVQPGNTVVDIGANYGVYALSLARKVGPSGKVWAFEPATETAQFLRESSAANGTTWLQVVQQALSDHEGTAWLQMPGQAELNCLVNADSDHGATQTGPGEDVELTTLDRCLERFNWEAVDLLKIDAEGEEERILKGGAQFFQHLSPLVMFEVKAGAEIHLDLVKMFQELGYQTYRLIPGLDALVPFVVDEEVDGYLLNLFAAKPDRAAKMAAAGWLVEQANQEGPKADGKAPESWLQILATQPYALRLAESWKALAHQPEQKQIHRALAAWEKSQDRAATLSSRCGALAQSYAVLKGQCQPGCPAGRWASLARVALACGERVQAVQALNTLITELQSGKKIDVNEPFLCPDPTFDAIEPTGTIEAWLEAAGLTALERISSFSGFYAGETAQPRLGRLTSLGYVNDTVRQRIALVQKRFEITGQEARSSSSVRAWFDFLGLDQPIRCIDVGAMGLQDEVEPWVRWANEGCAEVLGFEPLPDECEKLNQQAQANDTAIRYLPWALGDGLEHTLHISNAPMTSSLFPPARSTVDMFPALGEFMQVDKEVRLQTHRLDDIQEAVATDFLKLDVQGAELMILRNAQETLRSVSVIQCEVEFVELYEGQPLMADVDQFLRTQGFSFLRFAYTMGRPFKPWQCNYNSLSESSQILWGDAIYIRDFRNLQQWTNRHLQAAIFVLHEVLNAYDYVHFLMKELDKRCGSDLSMCYLAALTLNSGVADLDASPTNG
jgi:FkbM family methyltransferase